MNDDDLDSFIANIELTAPVDVLDNQLTCAECTAVLEEDEDGHFVCPICSVQATNILQLDDTELHHDEQGRPVYGQRVRLGEKRKAQPVNFGWAWSVDEAISHILVAQIKALKTANLLSEQFPTAVFNMFRKYWLLFIAPHIKDDYKQDELFPVDLIKGMKLRDIEVLLKVQDKVMIPTGLVKLGKHKKYLMSGKQFQLRPQQEDSESTKLDDEVAMTSVVEHDDDTGSGCSMDLVEDDILEEPDAEKISIHDLEEFAAHCSRQTRNLSERSITILTVNRTLAFLEAASRCLRQDDPLFAADLIRACNQRLIPFYGASKLLPEKMKLNPRDAMGFRKVRPPTPNQLTRAACLLITKVYKKQLPRRIPVPDIDTILERFISEMNLPSALFDRIKGRVSFHEFKATQSRLFTTAGRNSLPQYDRWAFAVLVIHLKNLFNLSDKQIIAQKEKAQHASEDGTGGSYFVFHEWLRQISLRLELVLRHDPFVLYHPSCDIARMVPTSQLEKYLEQTIEDKVHADIVASTNRNLQAEEEDRRDLADVLYRKFRPPPEIEREFFTDEKLQVSDEIRHPLTDAIKRTQRFWADKLEQPELDLVLKSFTATELILVDDIQDWTLFSSHDLKPKKGRKLEVPTWWPMALRVLLRVGAFLCYCQPVDLLDELTAIVKSYRNRRTRTKIAGAVNLPLLTPTFSQANAPRGYGRRPAND